MQDFLNQTYFGNSVSEYLTAIAILAAGILLVKILNKIVIKRLKRWAVKTETTFDDFLIRGIEKNLIPLLYYLILFLAVKTLTLSQRFERFFEIASVIIFTFFVLRSLNSLISYLLKSFVIRSGGDDHKLKQLRGIATIISFIIWTLGFVFVLDNFGFKVSAVIAGLGIGGIALALAAQAVLGDLFSYFVILFDRPFEIGDFITVADKSGTVEQVGIKTTRIRSLTGEQLIVSNTDLTNSRIHNFKRLEKRRVLFRLGIVYQTSSDKLKEIPEIVKNIIMSESKAEFNRGHFSAYGDFSLIFEFVYFVLDQDYIQFMEVQQNINLKIYEEFEKRGIEFAYPTQTLFINKTDDKK